MRAYSSIFSGHIIGLIRQKRSIGYQYQSEAGILSRFDKFCLTHYPDEIYDKQWSSGFYAAQRHCPQVPSLFTLHL